MMRMACSTVGWLLVCSVLVGGDVFDVVFVVGVDVTSVYRVYQRA